MTSSTLLILLLRRQVSLRDRILLKEALGTFSLGSALHLARKVLIFTFLAEAGGAVILSLGLVSAGHGQHSVWHGVFYSVSAFNNAGFDLSGEYRNLVPYRFDAIVLLPIAALIILGGISYTVVEDVVRERGRFKRLALDSKLVLLTTGGLLLFGTLAILYTERSNMHTLAGMSGPFRLLNAFFQGVSPRTAGFNSVDYGAMTEAGLVVTCALMFIGGSAGSTAGGIKVQTFSLLFFAIVAAARGSEDVEVFRRRVPTAYVLRAISVALLSIALVFFVSLLLSLSEHFTYIRLVFETISAFGTVGLSTGVTPHLSTAGRIVLMFTMFAGRLGPLTLVLALAARQQTRGYRWPEEAVKIG
jgi:trk system potassium uptake protein TrkH